MVEHEVNIEAQSYGEAEADGVALLTALEEAAAELGPSVMADDQRGMVLATLRLEGTDALVVHDDALELWRNAWEAAFPEQPAPLRLSVTVVPADVPAANASANGAMP